MNLSKLKDIVSRVTGTAKSDLEEAEKLRREREELRAKRRTERRKVQEQTDTAFEDAADATMEATTVMQPVVVNGRTWTPAEIAELSEEEQEELLRAARGVD